MGDVPEPPSDLNSRALPIETVGVGRILHRLHPTEYGGKYFGQSGGWRFDAPDKSYGTLYAAPSESACFVETLLRGVNNFVAQSELQKRSFCRFNVLVELRLAALYGHHLAALNASAAVASTPDYGISQRWSAALYNHKDQPDGIVYRANYDNNELAIVIFERASASIDAGASTPVMGDTYLLGAILDKYKASIR
jgi:hypothetical protein